MSTEPYYQDDHVTLYHGDCLTIDAWLAADVLVTDPPYGIAWRTGQMDAGKAPKVVAVAGDEDTAVRDATPCCSARGGRLGRPTVGTG